MQTYQYCMQRKCSKVSEKSFAIGTIAETLQSMGDAAVGFVLPLYPIIMTTVKDDDEEVRSNAIYGLGVLVANGGAVALPYPYCHLCTSYMLPSDSRRP